MARLLDAFKLAEAARRESAPVDAPAAVQVFPVVAEDDGDEPFDAPGVPFIEVGPRRSLEASADVLATRPNPVVISLPEPPAPRPTSPRTVAFRPLASVASFVAEVVAFHHPDDAASADYCEVLAATSAAACGSRTWLFTAAQAGVGVTTVVLNLAVTAARAGRRVVVVEAGGRRPALAARCGVSARPGLRETLAGGVTVEETLKATAQPRLSVVPIGVMPSGRIAAETVRSLLSQLLERCDLVLVDGSRWDGGPEAVAFGSACEAAFLVLPAEAEPAPEADELLRILPEQGVRMAGSILAGRGR